MRTPDQSWLEDEETEQEWQDIIAFIEDVEKGILIPDEET